MADEEVPKFDCRNWGRMHDGRWVAYVECDKDYAHRDDVKGPVIISGRRYTRTGVEISQRKGRTGQQLFKDEPIGLLIEGQI